ncbi:hypothetical protein [Halosimplex salinum]|uniref:hypothetical protein n=1 Tax=Halosimplex salinum TaxID=1710538 RepID=UPI000F478869|nr:hypothetical protein [Halosimplex salinum]
MLDTDPSGGDDAPDGGWAFVADRDGAARLIDALLDLDADETYTRSEIADRAGVPLKTLYLNGLLEECADLGLLSQAGGDGESPTGEETRYHVHADSTILEAAAVFDDACRSRSD